MVLLEAYLTFLLTFAVAFFWPLCHELPGAALASLGGLLLLPLFMASPFGASVFVRRRWGIMTGFIALTSFYLVMEGGLSRGPFAFPWPLLGHTQAEALRFNQFVDLTGVVGLSLWLWLLNGAAFSLTRARNFRSRSYSIGALIILLALPFSYSEWRHTHESNPSKWLTVGLVQPAISSARWSNVHDLARVDTMLQLSAPLFVFPPLPNLVLWPETTLPVISEKKKRDSLYQALSAWATDKHTALLTGAISDVTSNDASRIHYANSALFFRGAAPVTRYDKIRLVPFGERVPLLEYFPWLEVLTVPAGGVSGYYPGSKYRLFRVRDVDFGVLICFESAFGNHARQYVNAGAGFLVTLTQDGWWGRTPGYRQHLAITRLRAIESRRTMVQASVTGISALILPDGSTSFETAWMERTSHVARVPIFQGITFYTQHGDWLTGLALALSLVLAASILLRRRTK